MKRLLILIVLLMSAICSLLNAATYFVKPTGSDSNSGLSDALAWQHVQKGLQTAVAGDTVFIAPGTYDEASTLVSYIWGLQVNAGFRPHNDGNTTDGYIVFKGYSGQARPVILGKSLSTTYNSTFRPVVSFGTNDSYIIFDSLRFHGGYGGVHFPGAGVATNIHDIIIRNCIIDSTLGHNKSDTGSGTDDDNSGGIMTYIDSYEGTGDGEVQAVRNITVENCEIFANGLWQGWPASANYNMAGNTSAFHMYGCDSCLFQNNIIHDQAAGFHFKHQCRFTEVKGNTLYNIYGAAMWDRQTGNHPSYYTGVWQVGARWHHNVVYNSVACWWIGIGSEASTLRDSLAYFYNNTCDCGGSDTLRSGEYAAEHLNYGGVNSQFGFLNKAYIFNNIIYNMPSASWGAADDFIAGFGWGNQTMTPQNIYEDYNLYHGGNGNYFIWSGTVRNLTQWRAASPTGMTSGQGAHSVVDDPEFTNAGTRDYTLQSGSPAATGGKGGSFTFWPGSDRETTITLPTYMGAFAPSGACADTLVAPTFTSPANGATVSLNQVYLDWADSTQAGTVDTYDLQVDDNSDFGSTVFTSATAWSKDTVATTLKPYGTYYWRVRGRSDCDTSAWSGYRTFVQGDSCIQITGKGSLGTSDTCYCIVDSLLYTFAQRDTLINTNGKDNIRIWGYHTGGGRGIIGFSAADTGNLSWKTDTLKAAVALHISGSNNVIVNNLAIVPRTIPDSVHQIVGINALTAHDVLVENCSTRTSGFSSRAFQAFTSGGSSSYNLDLYNSYFGSASKGYRRRDQMYGATIAGDGSQAKTTSGYNYFLKVHKCRVQTIHAGISNSGGGNYPVVVYDSNTISVDTRNDLYMTYTDEVNYSTADPFGISIDGCDSLSEVIGNTITAGSSYYGGDGLLIQHVNASATNQMEVYGNVMTLNHGEHPAIQSIRQYNLGIYGRNYADPYFLKGLHIHDNSIALIVDTSQATNHIGYRAEGIRLGFENGSSDNLVEKNHITIVPADSSSRTGAGSFVTNGLAINQQDSLASGQTGTGRNNVIKNNYYRVPKTPLSYSEERIGIGANNIAIVGDTINTIYDGDSTFLIFHQGGTYGGHHIGNTLQDMILQGYANLADVIKGYVSDNPDSLGKQVSYTRSLTVNFKDVSSANINGGTIWAVDAYGHRHDMPNSNASGNSSDTLRWRFFGYDAMTGDGYVVADSNGYNNFTFWGKSGSDSASMAATINWTTSQAINVQLTESTPPAPVTTLRGITLKGVTIK